MHTTVSRTISALFAAILLASGVAPAQDDGPFVSVEKDKLLGRFLEEGTKAPDFEVKELDGSTVALADFAGKYLVLVFWATTGEEPKMLVQRFGDYADYFEVTEDLELFGIAAQKQPSDVQPFLEENDLRFFRTGYTTEPSLIRAYKATRLPVTYVIDPEGTVIGAIPYYSTKKVDEIIAFLAERGIGPVAGDEPPEDTEAPEDESQPLDPEALEIVRAMCEAYKSAEAMKYTSEMVFSWEGEQPGRQTRKISAILKRPNLVRAEVEVDSEKLGHVVSDGTQLWEYNADQNEFHSTPAPPDLAQPTESRLLRFVSSLFFLDDPYGAATAQLERISREGDAMTSDGRECTVIIQDHGRGGLYRVFMDKESNLVVRIEGEIKGAGPGGAVITMVETRTSELDPPLDDAVFEFVKPEGAKEAEIVPAPRILEDEAGETEQGGGEEGR